VKCEHCDIEHEPLFPHVCITASKKESVVHIYTPNELTPDERWQARQAIYRQIQKELDK